MDNITIYGIILGRYILYLFLNYWFILAIYEEGYEEPNRHTWAKHYFSNTSVDIRLDIMT